MSKDKDELKEALEEFSECAAAEEDNRRDALDDINFARLGKQWDDDVKNQREREGRPCLTINKLPAFIRQVVNDGRMNKPSIKVHPVDSDADPKTAEVINGLIRNIEYTSGADVAYDTGLESAVTCGFGYWRVNIDYAHGDTFDMDLSVQRIGNPFSVYGDPYSTSADSSDWNTAFITNSMSKDAFEAKYKGADKVDWNSDAYKSLASNWQDGENIIVAERWMRDEITAKILQLTNGQVVKEDWFIGAAVDMPGVTVKDIYAAQGITIKGDREAKSWKVRQQIMSGAEILERNDWAGIYIPIVPVYGEEINVEGKRHFRSLIRDSKDAQRMFNYWRTVTTELVALAPKTPFIGKVGAFDTDVDKWNTANTKTHSYIEHDGDIAPQRQPFAGVPAGALQEALNAADDMKSVMGIYDASLGARSNETSGVAINARKREGDASTFHFLDNQSRAIAHTGRILIDLIPHVYNEQRIIRVMGIDKKPQNIPINQPIQQGGEAMQGEDGMQQVFDLTVGKYDLTVSTGANYQTARQESLVGMAELVRVYPQSAPIIAPEMAKASDWPNADDMAEKLRVLDPSGKPPPALLQAQQQLQQMGQQLQQAQAQLQSVQADKQLEFQKLQIDDKNAETNRIKAIASMPKQEPDMGEDDDMREAEKIAMEGEIQLRLEAMRIEGEKELEMIRQRGAVATNNKNMLVTHNENLEPIPSEHGIESIMTLMQKIEQMQQLMMAPRKKTLVRGEDGRASHAVEEIILPNTTGEQ